MSEYTAQHFTWQKPLIACQHCYKVASLAKYLVAKLLSAISLLEKIIKSINPCDVLLGFVSLLVIGKAQQHLFYLQKLRKEHLPQRLHYRESADILPEGSSGMSCPTSVPSPPPVACSVHIASSLTLPTLPIICSRYYRQGKGSDPSKHAPPEW